MVTSESRLRAALRRLARRYAALRAEWKRLRSLEPQVYAALEAAAVKGRPCGVCRAQAFGLNEDLEPRCGFCIGKG